MELHKGHILQGEQFYMNVSPDKTKIVTIRGDEKFTMKIFKIHYDKIELIKEIKLHLKRFRGLTVSNLQINGNHVFFTHFPHLLVYSIETGKLAMKFKLQSSHHYDDMYKEDGYKSSITVDQYHDITCFAISDDGSKMLVGSEYTPPQPDSDEEDYLEDISYVIPNIFLFSLTYDGKIRYRLEKTYNNQGNMVTDVCFSHDNTKFAFQSDDGFVKVRDLEMGKQMCENQRIVRYSDKENTEMKFSKNNQYLISNEAGFVPKLSIFDLNDIQYNMATTYQKNIYLYGNTGNIDILDDAVVSYNNNVMEQNLSFIDYPTHEGLYISHVTVGRMMMNHITSVHCISEIDKDLMKRFYLFLFGKKIGSRNINKLILDYYKGQTMRFMILFSDGKIRMIDIEKK
jgi:WD40 repeat protein